MCFGDVDVCAAELSCSVVLGCAKARKAVGACVERRQFIGRRNTARAARQNTIRGSRQRTVAPIRSRPITLTMGDVELQCVLSGDTISPPSGLPLASVRLAIIRLIV